MRMQLYSRIVAPCVMFVLLLFSGQQGYIMYKGYKKTANKIADVTSSQKARATSANKPFSLFTTAVAPAAATVSQSAPLQAEIEGIVRSDQAWLSFAIIKTASGQQSYREGDNLQGYRDAWVEAINPDNVVVHYQDQTQVLALNKPDYFKGDNGRLPPEKTVANNGFAELSLSDYFVLKPVIDHGQLEGYLINPRNATPVFEKSGVEQGDMVVKVNATDMTNKDQARNIIADWTKMKHADLIVRRHNHLTNVNINVLTH